MDRSKCNFYVEAFPLAEKGEKDPKVEHLDSRMSNPIPLNYMKALESFICRVNLVSDFFSSPVTEISATFD